MLLMNLSLQTQFMLLFRPALADSPSFVLAKGLEPAARRRYVAASACSVEKSHLACAYSALETVLFM